MHSDTFISMLGASAFTHNDDISTAAELFISESLKLIILTVRSPIFNESFESFANEIVGFVKSEGISELIILSSTHSYEQHLVDKNPYEYVKNKKMTSGSLSLFSETSSALEKKIPGSGVALTLFDKATENDVAAIILYKYTSEGDNRSDAFEMLKKVNEFLNKPIPENDQIREPISWKFLFGCNVNPELY
mgnify:CR=1 FL=1